jgi:hypothetical protein
MKKASSPSKRTPDRRRPSQVFRIAPEPQGKKDFTPERTEVTKTEKIGVSTNEETRSLPRKYTRFCQWSQCALWEFSSSRGIKTSRLAPTLFNSRRHGNCGQSPPWTAVAAATAFRLQFMRQRRNGRRKKGGSCCYRRFLRTNGRANHRKAERRKKLWPVSATPAVEHGSGITAARS